MTLLSGFTLQGTGGGSTCYGFDFEQGFVRLTNNDNQAPSLGDKIAVGVYAEELDVFVEFDCNMTLANFLYRWCEPGGELNWLLGELAAYLWADAPHSAVNSMAARAAECMRATYRIEGVNP